MTRFLYLWTACMLTIAVLVACSLATQEQPDEDQGSVGEGVTPLVANVSRRQGPPLSDQAITDLVQANNAFATDLYRLVAAAGEDNLIFSPYSISLAFSMAYAGAGGDTEAQLQEAMHFLPQAQQHSAFNALERHFSSLSEGHVQGEEIGPAFQLEVANSLWGQQDAPFRDAYLQTLAAEYGAGLNTVDFGNNPEAAREAINAWIADATRQKIENMIAPDALTPQTQLVLANAIYFYGAWLQPFQESETEDGAFTLLDGSDVTVPLMHNSTLRAPYMEGDGLRAVLLPYTGRKADMLLILPDAGNFANGQEALDTALIQQLYASLETRDVNMLLPRFAFESEMNLAQALPQLGLTAPFDAAADFSGIMEGDLSIGVALHKATIVVDEVGTEASAVTIIAMEVSEMPRGEFHATRPFILAIMERETGAILFLGHVVDPSAASG